jgi:hypothetical protein
VALACDQLRLLITDDVGTHRRRNASTYKMHAKVRNFPRPFGNPYVGARAPRRRSEMRMYANFKASNSKRRAISNQSAASASAPHRPGHVFLPLNNPVLSSARGVHDVDREPIVATQEGNPTAIG